MKDLARKFRRRQREKKRHHPTRAIMCDFTEDTYVSTVWWADGDPDWMAMLWKRDGDDYWQFRYRFRYDSGTEDPFDGSDRKSCYRGLIDIEDEDDAIANVEQAIDVLHKTHIMTTTRHDIRCFGADALEKFAALPFAHAKIMGGAKA